MSDSIIQIQNVNKWFGDFQVLKEINLEVKPKEKIVVCGPSGSGKSTLIRCINRLEEHQKGNIIVDGTELSEDTNFPLKKFILGEPIKSATNKLEGLLYISFGLSSCCITPFFITAILSAKVIASI